MLAALGAAVIALVAIVPRLQRPGGIHAEVGFHHVGSLREGAPIIVAGRSVGRVESIVLVDAIGLAPGHMLAGTGGAMVHIRVADGLRWMVPANGEFFISSRGLLSDRYLEVGPPRGGAPPGPPLTAGAQIRGIDPPSIDRALQRTWNSLVLQRELVIAIEPEIAALRTNLDGLSVTLAEVGGAPARALGRQVGELADQIERLGQGLRDAGAAPEQLVGLVGRGRAGVDRARAALGAIRSALDVLVADLDRVGGEIRARAPQIDRVRGALVAARELTARIDGLLANGRELLAMLERGEGSFMKLRSDPEFPEEAKSVGKVLKRNPWRILGRPDDATALPRPPRRE